VTDALRQPPDSFLDAAGAHGIAFDPGDLDRLGQFLELLLEANRSFNLTRITDHEEAWHKHVLDSLTLLPVVVQSGATTLADVGTGGGLPGLPLAIVHPGLAVTLVEATGKKARFLEGAIETLALPNARVACERAETVGRDETQRERYDVVTARAVGPMRVLLELTVPLARVDGLVVAIKGAKAEAEIAEARNALHRLHARVETVVPTPTGRLVVVRKLRVTPKLYPRRPGEPKRDPL
jgi:16S rRNA (guanine527-N7)-methyltransferase